jgi:ABC-type transport system involved in multi-copper enzyme maturation permease subunit
VTEREAGYSSWAAFLAMARYELLWNIRKKKFLGMLVVAFVLATLSLFLPVLVSNLRGTSIASNPDYVIETGSGIGGFGFLLFAIVTAMNTISGEFESGTITPLLTKPVSRTVVFLGKVFAAFLTLLATYVVLMVYMAIGGSVIYGAQNNLHLLPLTLLGSLLSTFVWIAIVLALGSLSKSSMIAALGTFGFYMGASIITTIITVVTEQAWILNYVPGAGATGIAGGAGQQVPSLPSLRSISTGTDQIAANLVSYALNPSVTVEFYKGFFSFDQPIYTEPLGFILLRSILVAVAYACVFSLAAWYALKRAEVRE